MNTNGTNKGILNTMLNAAKGVANAAKNVVGVNSKNTNNVTRKNNSKPVTQGTMNAPVVNNSMKANSTMPQTGGMAPVNYRSANLQPSEKVMEWATTAGAPMPSQSEMRNVAHGGGKRRTRRNKKNGGTRRKSRSSCMGGRRRIMKRKSHKRKSHRRHQKRRN